MVSHGLLLTITCLMSGILITCSSELFEGATVVFKGSPLCENDSYLGKDQITKYIKLTKFNRTHNHMYCNFTLPFDIDENLIIDLDIKKKTQTGFGNVIRFTSQYCKFLQRHFKELMNTLFLSGGHDIKDCPIPKGFYFWDSVLDMKLHNFPYIPNGDYYEATAVLLRGERRRKVLCVKFAFQIKSKVSHSKDDTLFQINSSN